MAFVLQNVVFPTDRDPDLLPLYVDADSWSTIDGVPVRVATGAHIADVISRDSLRIRGGERTSLASYFNAFPASYWQHWTAVRRVRLEVRTSGSATILVYRSNGSGVQQRIDTAEVTGEATSTFEIALTQFSDGGWVWFDVVAGDDDVDLVGAAWSTDQEPARTGKASLGITTYNKPGYCVETLQALASSPGVLEVVDRIFLIDQGDDRVDAQVAFPELAASLGETLQVLTQRNLGGSGGFARAMHETMQRDESDFVQLLDDDVKIEPESIRRSIVFGRYATKPVIVGAHMFDLLDRPRLHAWAEVIDEAPFMWRTLYQEQMPHDFREQNLRQARLLHMRMDADYNGWWMCLIPKAVIAETGLPLPAFIKWDDAEYSVRAREHGFPTVTLPGAALWHVSWVGKDDSIDWQAYFHARNRIVAGLLHSPQPVGGTLLRHSQRMDLKHLMMMQYYPAALRNLALRDVLSGPGHMRKTLATRMPLARKIAKKYPETVVHRDPDEVLHSVKGRQVFELRKRGDIGNPTGLALRIFTAKSLLRHLLTKPAPRFVETPEVEFGKEDAEWWRVPHVDSALVSAADGSGKQIYVRNRETFRTMLFDSIRLHRRLKKQWPKLAREYREALPSLVAENEWMTDFEAKA